MSGQKNKLDINDYFDKIIHSKNKNKICLLINISLDQFLKKNNIVKYYIIEKNQRRYGHKNWFNKP